MSLRGLLYLPLSEPRKRFGGFPSQLFEAWRLIIRPPRRRRWAGDAEVGAFLRADASASSRAVLASLLRGIQRSPWAHLPYRCLGFQHRESKHESAFAADEVILPRYDESRRLSQPLERHDLAPLLPRTDMVFSCHEAKKNAR